MVETTSPSTPPLTREEKLAILTANASPQVILERMWHAQRRGVTHSSVKSIAGFGTTQARVHTALLDLKDRGLVFHDVGNGWRISNDGVKYLSQMWQEAIDRERNLRAAAFDGWTQGQLFTEGNTTP